MNDNLSQIAIQRHRRKLTQREYRLLCAFVIVVLPLAIFWKPIRRQSEIYFLLRADVPSPEVLSKVVQQTGDPKSLLLRLWQTGRIPDRHFVLSYLGRIANREPELFHAMEPIVTDATTDADITTRELAFGLLARMKLPQLQPLALGQLADADPAARLVGLQRLRSIATTNDVPRAMRLLDDSDPRVVVAAALVLRQATGLNFGIKSSSLALPRFTSITTESGTDTNPPQAYWNTNAIVQGVQRWRDWWKEHQADYSVSTTPLESIQPAGLATSDFSLEDADGKAVRLSDFRGKVVVLAFWSLDAPVTLDDAPALDSLQRHDPENLAILGIMVSSAPDDDMPDMPDMPGMQHAAPALNTAAGRAAVRNFARQRQINFPMLLDAQGEISPRFAVEEDLPVYVLVDAQGIIRRRLVGFRSQPVFGALIAEAIHTKTVRSNTP